MDNETPPAHPEHTPPAPPPPAPAAPQVPQSVQVHLTQAAPTKTGPDEIRIISHSMLFYWWPVWAMGFIMALLTMIDGHRMALVPSHTEGRRKVDLDLDGVKVKRDILVLPESKLLLPDTADKPGDPPPKPQDPHLLVTKSSSYGVIYAMTLVLVIIITSVPLRGLWSIIVIVFIAMIVLIFGLLDWWSAIFHYISILDIRINMAGYLFISIVLFVAWMVSMLFFDRQIYIVFTPGQLRVCTEIGGGEISYDTAGMVVQKERSNFFQHWVLGLGSGDLIVRTSGANSHEFHLNNVLFVSRKLFVVEQMQKEKAVVRSG